MGKKKFRPVPKEMLGSQTNQLEAAIRAKTNEEHSSGQYRGSTDRSYDSSRRRNNGGQYNQSSRDGGEPGEESSASSNPWRSSTNGSSLSSERSSKWRNEEGQNDPNSSRSHREYPSSRNQWSGPRESTDDDGNSSWRSRDGGQGSQYARKLNAPFSESRSSTRNTWSSRDQTSSENTSHWRTDTNSERVAPSTEENKWRSKTANRQSNVPSRNNRTHEEFNVSQSVNLESRMDDMQMYNEEENQETNISIVEHVEPSTLSSTSWCDSTIEESEISTMDESVVSTVEESEVDQELQQEISGSCMKYRPPSRRNTHKMDSSQGYRKHEKGRDSGSYNRNSHGRYSSENEDRGGGFRNSNIFQGNVTKEQEGFISYLSSKEATNFSKVREEERDLFEVEEDYALAHCVAEDMNMGSGIAVEFRSRFKKVAELLDQRAETGGLAFLELKGRFIYYLVTKRKSQGKPTYYSLWSSLLNLRTHMTENKVTKLAMPRIGCGLDRLNWDCVKPMLEFLFKNEDVEILICNHQPDGQIPKVLKKCRVVHESKTITAIDPETIIIYFASRDGKITEEMKILDEKFKFLPNFEQSPKAVGENVRFVPLFNKNYVLYGCIVKDNLDDQFGFSSFASCLHKIAKNYKLDNFYYIAFQSLGDDLLNAKILNLMKHTLRDIDIYICGCSEAPSDE